MRLSFQAKAALVFLAVTALAAQQVFAGWQSAIAAGTLLLVLTLILGAVLADVSARRVPARSPFEAALERAPSPSRRPADLVAFERSFGWGVYRPSEFRHQLKPILEEIARHRSPAVDAPSDVALLSEDRNDVALIRTDEISRLLDQIERMR